MKSETACNNPARSLKNMHPCKTQYVSIYFILCKITQAGLWQSSYAEACHKLFTERIHETCHEWANMYAGF